MCTTYLAYRIITELEQQGLAELLDYPWLIRLNPNIPAKTRGNGAVALHLRCKSNINKIKEIIIDKIEQLAVLEDEQTHPGVVFLEGNIPRELHEFYWKAVREVVSIEDAIRLCEQLGIEYYCWKLGRGIIGALAAVGAVLDDWTYELLVYRALKDGKRPRRISPLSVYRMDAATFPQTFDNIDYEHGTVLIAPRGPDPVLCGIRGEEPEVLQQAFALLEFHEPVEGWIIFRTNQATDHHLVRKQIKDVRQYDNVILVGRVASWPRVLPGGHVLFELEDGTGKIACIAYRETGKKFRKIVQALGPGDIVEVYGSVASYPGTVNLEKLKVLRLAKIYKEQNPRCPKCGARMHSLGKNKGFKCRNCGYTAKLEKERIELQREIAEGFYDVAPDARRHISKPVLRFGREKWLEHRRSTCSS